MQKTFAPFGRPCGESFDGCWVAMNPLRGKKCGRTKHVVILYKAYLCWCPTLSPDPKSVQLCTCTSCTLSRPGKGYMSYVTILNESHQKESWIGPKTSNQGGFQCSQLHCYCFHLFPCPNGDFSSGLCDVNP